MPPRRRDVGVVFQNYALFPHMTVARNVAFGLRRRGIGRAETTRRVRDALEMVRLAGLEERMPRELSGGQQQRVALARALVTRPRLLLLDEPLSALDKSLRTQMQVELREIQQSVGIATVFVTHDQSEALALSDRVVVMSEGSVQQLGNPMDIYRRPGNAFVASFVGEVNMLSARLAEASEGGLVLDFGAGRQLAVAAEQCGGTAPGAAVNVFIRPESLKPARTKESALLCGKVLAHVCQSGFVDLHCSIEGLGEVRLRTLGYDSLVNHPIGSELPIEPAVQDLVVFAAAQ